MKSAQPSIPPANETLSKTSAAKITALWMFTSGVRPRNEPSTIPAASWPGVPSECSAPISDCISLINANMGLRDHRLATMPVRPLLIQSSERNELALVERALHRAPHAQGTQIIGSTHRECRITARPVFRRGQLRQTSVLQ